MVVEATVICENIGPPPQVHEHLSCSDHLPKWAIDALVPIRKLNCIQSASFATCFHTDESFTVAAPCGTGKTALALLALLRLYGKVINDDVKRRALYVVPPGAEGVVLCRLRRRLTPLGACIRIGNFCMNQETSLQVMILSTLPKNALLSEFNPSLVVFDRPERFCCEEVWETLFTLASPPPCCRRIALMDGPGGLAGAEELASALGTAERVWMYDDRYRFPALRTQTLLQLEPNDDAAMVCAEAIQHRKEVGEAVFAFIPCEPVLQQVANAVGWESRALASNVAFEDLDARGLALYIASSIDFVWREGSDFPECSAILVLTRESELPHALSIRQALGRAEELVVVASTSICEMVVSLLQEPFDWRQIDVHNRSKP